jgi:hypothetical protein
MRIEVINRDRSQIDLRVLGPVWDKLWIQASRQVREEVDSQVWCPVRDLVRYQVVDSLFAQAEEEVDAR